MEAQRIEPRIAELKLVRGSGPEPAPKPVSWSACAGVAGLGGVGLAAFGLSTPVLAGASQRAAAASAGSWLFFAGLLLAFTALSMSRGSRGALWWLRAAALLLAAAVPQLSSSPEFIGVVWGAVGAWEVASIWAERGWLRACRHSA